jgi:hypothetical protein
MEPIRNAWIAPQNLAACLIAAPGSNSQAQSATPADGGTTTVSCPCTNGNDCGPPTYNANTGYSCPNPANCGAAANCQIKVVINNPITD